jgi:hypothetical protein
MSVIQKFSLPNVVVNGGPARRLATARRFWPVRST